MSQSDPPFPRSPHVNEFDSGLLGFFANWQGALAWDPPAETPAAPEKREVAISPPRVVAESAERLDDSTLVELAVQVLRLERRVEGLDPEAHPRERKMFADSARRFARLVQQFGVEYEDPTGQVYVTGRLDVEVLSWEEPSDGTPNPHGSGSWIKRTMRPIVKCGGRRLASGQIVVVDEKQD